MDALRVAKDGKESSVLTQQPANGHQPISAPHADVICFGMITPAIVMTVDDMPAHNTGAQVKTVREFISDDAAIVAMLLRGWNVRSGLIGTALGDDAAGRGVVHRLQNAGVAGHVRLSPEITTPFEVNVSDLSGERTYFWQRDPTILATLATAELSLLSQARLLYVDWYDGDYILRPMAEARRLGVPVFLNLEYGHDDLDRLTRFGRDTTICQVVTDAAQQGGDAMAIARTVLASGVETVLVTLGAEGCLVMNHSAWFRVEAPEVNVVDGCGAGATFSAGIIYGYLQRWELETIVRFAVAAASLKCTVVGPQAFPLPDIHELAADLNVALGTLATG